MYFKSSLVTDGPYVQFNSVCPYVRGFPGGLVVKNPFANAGGPGGTSFIPGLGRSPGEGTGNPLKYSCLENSMDRRAWRATICGVAKSQTQCSNWALTHPHISRMVIFGLGFQDKLYPFALCRQKKTKTKTKTKKQKNPIEYLYILYMLLFQLVGYVRLFCDLMDCSLPDSSVDGISQASILKWVAIFFSGILYI